MSVPDLVGELLGHIDFEKSEIIKPRKLVFVCGGKESRIIDAPTSLREIFLKRAAALGKAGHIGDVQVLLAEEAVDALATSSFGNLLDLEEYIAAVVDAVLLVVESPGSMCELGAFVKTEEIREKLIVILPSEHENRPSFITNGAVRFLKENYSSAQVLGFHWQADAAGVVAAPDYALNEMAAAIPTAIQQVHSAHAQETIKVSNIGHLIYLTLAFCHLLRAAKLIDLKNCFANARITISETSIKRCIDTLTICKLLKPIVNGKLTYHVALVGRIPLEIRWKPGTKNRDRNTMRWIARVAAEVGEEDLVRLEIFKEHSNG